MSGTDPLAPIPPGTPCEGCSQPRETENGRFVVSSVKALKRNGDRGCPTCPLILQGIEKCLGHATVAESRHLLLVFNGTGVWDFHVIVDGDDAVSFFVSPGRKPPSQLTRGDSTVTISQGSTRPTRQ